MVLEGGDHGAELRQIQSLQTAFHPYMEALHSAHTLHKPGAKMSSLIVELLFLCKGR